MNSSTQKAPHIIIIETGTLDAGLEAKYGDYPAMFERLLSPEGLTLSTCRLVRGEALPALDAADGFLVTGSRHGVYDDLPWMEPLKAFIRECAAHKKPMVGICFGHQIMAEALGGKVEKSAKGWGLGPQSYALHDARARFGGASETRVNAIHQDQVIAQPPDSEVIASSDFCEFAGLSYGGDTPYAMSIQPHPEFDDEFVGELVKSRRGDVYPEEVADAALGALDEPINAEDWAGWIAGFFKSAAH